MNEGGVFTMPQLSLYLKDKTLESVRARAVAAKIPVSQVVRLAVETYLATEEKKAARGRVLSFLEGKPLGGKKAWQTLHKERTGADDCRS